MALLLRLVPAGTKPKPPAPPGLAKESAAPSLVSTAVSARPGARGRTPGLRTRWVGSLTPPAARGAGVRLCEKVPSTAAGAQLRRSAARRSQLASVLLCFCWVPRVPSCQNSLRQPQCTVTCRVTETDTLTVSSASLPPHPSSPRPPATSIVRSMRSVIVRLPGAAVAARDGVRAQSRPGTRLSATARPLLLSTGDEAVQAREKLRPTLCGLGGWPAIPQAPRATLRHLSRSPAAPVPARGTARLPRACALHLSADQVHVGHSWLQA